MTTEEDFRKALNDNPADWQTLAVFSDWLRDHDDPRADGYAVLAALKRVPIIWAKTKGKPTSWCWLWSDTFKPAATTDELRAKTLTRPWWDGCKTEHTMPCECFDHAASAFVKLDTAERHKILAYAKAGAP